MVNFLILLKELSIFSKEDIDKGNTPLDVYSLCSCIRESFCLSYSIRHNNKLYLYLEKIQILIKFDGEKLRFLGSDERSQAILLNKAIIKINEFNKRNYKEWIKSTPGIYVKKVKDSNEMYKFLQLFNQNEIIIIQDFIYKTDISKKVDFKELEGFDQSLYIIPFDTDIIQFPNLMRLFGEFKTVKYMYFPNIKSIENKILYINFMLDHQKHFSK